MGRGWSKMSIGHSRLTSKLVSNSVVARFAEGALLAVTATGEVMGWG